MTDSPFDGVVRIQSVFSSQVDVHQSDSAWQRGGRSHSHQCDVELTWVGVEVANRHRVQSTQEVLATQQSFD